MDSPLYHPLYEKHQAMLEQALIAIQNRGYWSPYSDNAHVYGEGAIAAGRVAFDAFLDAQFYLDQPGVMRRAGAEASPYGMPLGVRYPLCDSDALIAAGRLAMPAWVKAGADTRAGVCIEMLARINDASMQIAHALMHTTGQSLITAFQSGGPHAQDRGLEAIAMAYREMRQVPDVALWKRMQGLSAPVHMERVFRLAPRGVALVVGCSTFPTWHAYPGLFASLATGNPVIVKPHPLAILPLAISVALMRQTLKDAGFDANLVTLLVDEPDATATREVALKPDIRIIDYTGNRQFGEWLALHARQAELYLESGGVNCIVVDSTDDYEGLLRNLAVTLSLNSGQMKTSPQTLLVSSSGVGTDCCERSPQGRVAAHEFCQHLAQALGRLLDDEARAVEVLGAIQSPWVEERMEQAADRATVVRASVTLSHPLFPAARIRTPLLLEAYLDEEALWMAERSGPVSFVVRTASTAQSLAVVERTIRDRGAMSLSVYSTDPDIRQLSEDLALRVGVALSLNLVDGVHVNQTSGFSDFLGSGVNPASNTSLGSSAFVARRFFVAPVCRHLAPTGRGSG